MHGCCLIAPSLTITLDQKYKNKDVIKGVYKV